MVGSFGGVEWAKSRVKCDDCREGDHDECKRQGGWPHQDTNERCDCHLSGHPRPGGCDTSKWKLNQ